MQAHLSLLRCTQYFVTDLSCSSNSEHNPDKPVEVEFKDLVVESASEDLSTEEHPNRWAISLDIRQNVPTEKNAPYNFAIELVGDFEVHPDVPKEAVQRLVEVNGSSLLFTAARQILLDVMHRGPFTPMILPTVSFVDPAPSEGPASSS